MGARVRGRSRLVATVIAVALLVASAPFATSVVSARASSSVTVADAVARILADTNALRAAGGLAPLVLNSAISAVAQNWSAQLGINGSLSHNPGYTTQIPAGWTRAAENVAMDYTYTSVVEGWHQSSGHYANIMGQYTDIGIGYVEANGHRYFTQNFGFYATTVVPRATTSPAPVPVVSGNRILDARTSAPFVPHAVNWPSFEYACQQGWAYSASGATAAAAAAMASWKINAVRLPLNEACWLGADGQPAYGTASGYRAALRAWVDKLNAAGLVVILDLHWSSPSGPSDGQRAMTDARSVTFWQQVATAYASVPSVIFDVFNEPYSRGSFQLTWSCWSTGGCAAPVENDVTSPLSGATYPVVGMTQVLAAIRGAGATQPVMLAGIDYSNDLRGWLANRPADTQLIASWHNYPGQRCQNVACWNSEIAPVADIVPVIASEFGQTDGGSSFLTAFMDWADTEGIGYAPWAWWVVDPSESVSSSRYALISNLTTFTPKAPSGTAYHDHLAALVPPAPPGTTTVYRFWRSTASAHFYTASATERDRIITTYADSVWHYEGAAYNAAQEPGTGKVPLYRFWSSLYQGHFYTTSETEKASIIADYDESVWSYEGIAYYVWAADDGSSKPVIRFWSPRTKHHFYTADAVEAAAVDANFPDEIWTREGLAFWVK